MNDLLYYAMNLFPYLVALMQCIMYVFVIILLAKATKPLVNALKAYTNSKKACCCTPEATAPAITPATEEPTPEA